MSGVRPSEPGLVIPVPRLFLTTVVAEYCRLDSIPGRLVDGTKIIYENVQLF
jgi:hypothetical protein